MTTTGSAVGSMLDIALDAFGSRCLQRQPSPSLRPPWLSLSSSPPPPCGIAQLVVVTGCVVADETGWLVGGAVVGG